MRVLGSVFGKFIFTYFLLLFYVMSTLPYLAFGDHVVLKVEKNLF